MNTSILITTIFACINLLIAPAPPTPPPIALLGRRTLFCNHVTIDAQNAKLRNKLLTRIILKDSMLVRNNTYRCRMSGHYSYSPKSIILNGSRGDYLNFKGGIISEQIKVLGENTKISGNIISASSISLKNETCSLIFEGDDFFELQTDLFCSGGSICFKSNVIIPESTAIYGPAMLQGNGTGIIIHSGEYLDETEQLTKNSTRTEKILFTGFTGVYLRGYTEITEPWIFRPIDYPMIINGEFDFIKVRGNGKLILDSTYNKIFLKNLIILNDTGSDSNCVEYIGNKIKIISDSVQITNNPSLYDYTNNIGTKPIKRERNCSVEISSENGTIYQSLIGNLCLQKENPFVFPKGKNIVIDGQGFRLQCRNKHLVPFGIPQNTNVIFKNINIKPFNSRMFSLGQNSQICFAENCVLEATSPITLNNLFKLNITGNVILTSDKHDIKAYSNSINIKDNAKLTIQHSKLKIIELDAINISNTATLELDNSQVKCRNDWLLEQGALSIKNKVSFFSADVNTGNSFLFLTDNAKINICKESKLVLSSMMNLFLNESSASVNFMSNETSKLVLDGSSLIIGESGFEFNSGKILINKQVSLYTNEQPLKLSNVKTEILPGAKLSVHGSLCYDENKTIADD